MTTPESHSIRPDMKFEAREFQHELVQKYSLTEEKLEQIGANTKEQLSVYSERLLVLGLFDTAAIILEDTDVFIDKEGNLTTEAITEEFILPLGWNTFLDKNGQILECEYWSPNASDKHVITENQWINKAEIELSLYAIHGMEAFFEMAQRIGTALQRQEAQEF